MKKLLFIILLLFVPVLLPAQDDVYHFQKDNSYSIKVGRRNNRKQAYPSPNQLEKRKTVHRGQAYAPNEPVIETSLDSIVDEKQKTSVDSSFDTSVDSSFEKIVTNPQTAGDSLLAMWLSIPDSIRSATIKPAFEYYIEKGNELPRDVTKFLGIPVDGSKVDMIKKLQEKGFDLFPYYEDDDILTGQFNGRDVMIFVGTNNRKVYRIMVTELGGEDKESIRIRFNNLCYQFGKSKKYTSLEEDQTIPSTEDIGWEISVHAKKYDAIFYQIPDSIKADDLMRKIMLSKYTEEELENPTDAILDDYYRSAMMLAMEMAFKKQVWFRINENGDKYQITIYYDNTFNEANGEDL